MDRGCSEEYDWMMCEQTLNLTDGSMSYELFEELCCGK